VAASTALCAVELVNAKQAGDALAVVARKLDNAGILTSEGAALLEREGRRIAGLKDRHSWDLLIDPDNPLKFAWTKDKNGEDIQPLLSANLMIDQSLDGCPPFSALDIAIQFEDLASVPVARWHLDVANAHDVGFQPGPLFHLQFGGHQRGYRELDHRLKAPRWCHPPMEAALLSEVIAANFFEDKWLELREDVSWCEAISQFQRLCYPSYFNKLAIALNTPRSTVLKEVWAGDWSRSLNR
jgi:hypothetical protein